MKKLLLGLLVVAVLGGAAYWFKHRGPAEGGEAAEPAPAARVETAPLQQKKLAQTVDAFGTVAAQPSHDISLSAPYDCLVRAIHVGVGARVTAGQVLVEIDPSPDAKLSLESARTASTLAEKTLAATRQRVELKLATSQDLVAAEQGADDARAKLASLQARGLGSGGKLTAPTAGVVSKLDLATGALVPAGTLLVSVAAADHLEARLGVEIAQLAEIHAGEPASLSSANRPELPAVATTVRAAGGSIDATTGTAEVRVPVPADSPFYYGEHVRAAIVVHESEGLVAPRQAVLPDDDKNVLFTVRNGKAVRHEVKLGLAADGLVEVIGDDLHAGDAVVTLGNYELNDGMAVQSGDAAAAEEKPAAPAPAKEGGS